MPALYASATAACLLLASACAWCALACDDHELLIYASLLVAGVATASAPRARLPRVERSVAQSVPAVEPHKAAA